MTLLSATSLVLFLVLARQTSLSYGVDPEDPFAGYETTKYGDDWKGTGITLGELTGYIMYNTKPDMRPLVHRKELKSALACATECFYDEWCGMSSFYDGYECYHVWVHHLEFIILLTETETLAVTNARVPATAIPPPTEAPKPTDPPDDTGDSPGCFSESTTVECQDRGTVTVKDLEVGDRVFIGEDPQNLNQPKYETVYSFGQYHETWPASFLQIYTDGKARRAPPLEVTKDHLVLAAKKADGPVQLVRADAIKVGDILVRENLSTESDLMQSQVKVTKISRATKNGLYMPLTPSGSLVVNGLKASAYVSIQDEAPSVAKNVRLIINEDRLLHWWLAPHRMLCMGVSSHFCGTKNSSSNFQNEEGILNWLFYGRQLAQWANRQSFVVRFVLLGLPLLVVFGCLVLLEFLFGPAMAPIISGMALVCLLYFWKAHKTGTAGTTIMGLRKKKVV